MSLQRRLDAFKSAFESGGPPYNVFRERIEIMHQATEDLRRSAIWRRRSSSPTRMPRSCGPPTWSPTAHW